MLTVNSYSLNAPTNEHLLACLVSSTQQERGKKESEIKKKYCPR